MRTLFLAAFLSSTVALPAVAAEPVALVICAPGYPGSTAEAQPTIDSLAQTMAKAAKWAPAELTGVYYEKQEAGVTRLSQPDVGLALLPLALFLEQQEALKLKARLSAAMKGRAEATERWTLIAKKGSLPDASALEGWEVHSLVGFSPRFIRSVVLSGWGKVPENVKFVQTGRILSAMKKASAGAKVAVLLDSEQAEALAKSPDPELVVVHQSAFLPAAILATVGSKVSDTRWKTMGEALPKLGETPEGAKVLESVQKLKFMPLDEKVLVAAQKAFQEPRQ
ncbi:MAG: hypothetical protein HY901_01995 [Deltaproteobacteria bacterium]|nr:hypothetical protein [Deltaproteobacteria bacterium]